MEKFQRSWDGGHRFKRQPDEAGDEVGELEGGFPFSKIVGREHLAGFDGDLAEAGDEKFPADDEGGDPDGTDAFCGEKYKCGADENFISKRIEEFTERGDKVHFPGQPAIDEIADGRDDEQNQGGDMAPRALPSHEKNERRSQDKA